MRGRGTQLTELVGLPRLWILLFCPPSSVSTAECYRAYDLSPVRTASTEECIRALKAGDLSSAGKAMRNALYPSAAKLNRDVADALEAAKGFSPLGAAMTGSGSAVFALFETKELCEWAASRYRGNCEVCVLHTV